MNLSAHFTLAELTHSQTADRLGLDNDPPPEVVENLRKLALGLEMVRALIGAPIHVSSGYRSPAVNRAVGGSRNSQHMTGQAADITAPGFGTPLELVKAITGSAIPFDQCILEFPGKDGRSGWCHISFADEPRRQALMIDHDGTRAFA